MIARSFPVLRATPQGYAQILTHGPWITYWANQKHVNLRPQGAWTSALALGLVLGLRHALVEALNGRMWRGEWTRDEGFFDGVGLRQETQDLLRRDTFMENRRRLIRLLMEDAFPTELSRSPGAIVA